MLPRLLGTSLLLGVTLVGASRAPAAESDDRQLLAFWEKRAAASLDAEAATEVCRKDLASQSNSVYLPVIRGVLAWHELAAGQTEAATATLKSMLSADKAPLAAAANTMANRWLTRLDRERVRKVLSGYYAQHVAYPESLAPVLAALPEKERPPATDRWNHPWQYRLAAFKRLTGLSDQRYELLSVELAADSDLKATLRIPYDAPADLTPVRVLSRFENQVAVEFQDRTSPPRKAVLTEGTRSGKLYFVRLLAQSVLLSDGDRWHLVPLP